MDRNPAMRDTARMIREADPVTLMREAIGLAGLCVAILATMFLPAIA
jgi:hypothetical protein